MKKGLLKLLPITIISIVMGYMLFIYEQITLYAGQLDNFSFDFSVLLNNNIIYLLSFVGIVVVFSAFVLFISEILKKSIIYKIYFLLFNIVFIVMYIHGNFLVGSLPILDGSAIEWNTYLKEMIISTVVVVLIIGISIFLLIKLKDSYNKVSAYIAIAIFVMLSTSLVTTLTTTKDLYTKKGVYTVTSKDIGTLSKDKNFLILLIDMVDSRTFDKVVKAQNKLDVFKDFTFYPDTLSAYPFTREEIPYILSGEWFEEKETFAEYYNKALTNSKFIEGLKKEGYTVNIYEEDTLWTDEESKEINNVDTMKYDISKTCFLKQEMKYNLFKYLPFPLKRFSHIESMNYNSCREDDLDYVFSKKNQYSLNHLGDVELRNDKYFHFLHVEGGHTPWDVGNGTYEEKLAEALELIEHYLDRIKKSGQYDNSVIIILSDHGYNNKNAVGRQNPPLYIKGINEKHDEMQISDKKVSHVDFNESIYWDLLKGYKSDELLKDISDNRIRRYLWYKNYDDIYEQTLDGHAWETDKLVNTGKHYTKKKK